MIALVISLKNGVYSVNSTHTRARGAPHTRAAMARALALLSHSLRLRSSRHARSRARAPARYARGRAVARPLHNCVGGGRMHAGRRSHSGRSKFLTRLSLRPRLRSSRLTRSQHDPSKSLRRRNETADVSRRCAAGQPRAPSGALPKSMPKRQRGSPRSATSLLTV